MRDIPQKYLDFGNDLMRRTECCIVDEISVSWRTLAMKFVWDGSNWDGGSGTPLPGEISINFNSVFDVRIEGVNHRIDTEAIDCADPSSGIVLLLIRKRVKAADLDRHRLKVLFENGWEIVVHLEPDGFEPIIIWDCRKPIDWLAL